MSRMYLKMKEKPLLNRSGWQGDRRRYTIPFLQGRGRFPPGTYSFTGQASTNGKQRRGGGQAKESLAIWCKSVLSKLRCWPHHFGFSFSSFTNSPKWKTPHGHSPSSGWLHARGKVYFKGRAWRPQPACQPVSHQR